MINKRINEPEAKYEYDHANSIIYTSKYMKYILYSCLLSNTLTQTIVLTCAILTSICTTSPIFSFEQINLFNLECIEWNKEHTTWEPWHLSWYKISLLKRYRDQCHETPPPPS